ncbi:unnamed protein product [Vitrella brassicaformis CCMP3155]|uniref:Uncharacterized protein n=1 Tax=Vitrella brassicaformis (strain CCMP3155) TaxID=1169540 RepID=A0A0G4H0U1_VITBC|nr:unnamed protein product [Vitrella brassicaformis CCMP3155]|mmetsp:Transcript_22890/g.56509  ORF Transcript_22890/g.56509 Transcript_22890/m.56509 type:complete len:273 (-) Transcript_22890:6640-7458(-)|eukprot:CEM37190.1 unnamed protein product [Vitrella brassicaformis CCMP3155]
MTVERGVLYLVPMDIVVDPNVLSNLADELERHTLSPVRLLLRAEEPAQSMGQNGKQDPSEQDGHKEATKEDCKATSQPRALPTECLLMQLKPLVQCVEGLSGEKGVAAVIGITSRDLSPHEEWTFAFGQADPAARVAIVSLARLSDSPPPGSKSDAVALQDVKKRKADEALGICDAPPAQRRRVDKGLLKEEGPESVAEADNTEAPSGSEGQQARRLGERLLKVVLHETYHLWGLQHCSSRGSCRMAPCSDVHSLDEAPLHLCTECREQLKS